MISWLIICDYFGMAGLENYTSSMWNFSLILYVVFREDPTEKDATKGLDQNYTAH